MVVDIPALISDNGDILFYPCFGGDVPVYVVDIPAVVVDIPVAVGDTPAAVADIPAVGVDILAEDVVVPGMVDIRPEVEADIQLNRLESREAAPTFLKPAL